MGTARMGYIGFRAPRHVSLKNRLFVAGTPQKLLIIFSRGKVGVFVTPPCRVEF